MRAMFLALACCGTETPVLQARLARGLTQSDVSALAVYAVQGSTPDCAALRAVPIATGRDDVDVRYYRRVAPDAALDFADVTPMTDARVVVEAYGASQDVVAVGCSDVVTLRAGETPAITVTLEPR